MIRKQQITSLSHIVLVLVLFAFLVGCASRDARLAQRFFSETPPPVEYEPKPVTSWELENGLKVFFVEDHELPLVQGTLYLSGGSFWEEAKGSVSAMGVQLREGGTLELEPDALDRKLEELSASIRSSFGGEFGTVGFRALSSDFDEVFELYRDVILEPGFDSARLKLWKLGKLEGVRRRADDPESITSIATAQLLFGDSPYGKPLTSSSIKNLSRADVLRAHRKFVRPDGAYLSLSGGISLESAKKAVAKAFGGWEPRGDSLGEPPLVQREAAPGVYFIEGDFPQANVRASHLGPKRHTRDMYAIKLFNDLFGSGGFDSRLMQELRVRRGLVYGVWGAISPGRTHGVNFIFLQTKGATAAEGIEASIEQLEFMTENLPEEERLQSMKTAAQGSFVFKFVSSEQIADRQAILKILEYPSDYDDEYLNRIISVDPEAIQEVARKRWTPEEFIIVVVGDGAAWNSLLQARKDGDGLISRLPLFRASFEETLGPVRQVQEESRDVS